MSGMDAYGATSPNAAAAVDQTVWSALEGGGTAAGQYVGAHELRAVGAAEIAQARRLTQAGIAAPARRSRLRRLRQRVGTALIRMGQPRQGVSSRPTPSRLRPNTGR